MYDIVRTQPSYLVAENRLEKQCKRHVKKHTQSTNVLSFFLFFYCIKFVYFIREKEKYLHVYDHKSSINIQEAMFFWKTWD